jgi:hypothetical protein
MGPVNMRIAELLLSPIYSISNNTQEYEHLGNTILDRSSRNIGRWEKLTLDIIILMLRYRSIYVVFVVEEMKESPVYQSYEKRLQTTIAQESEQSYCKRQKRRTA